MVEDAGIIKELIWKSSQRQKGISQFYPEKLSKYRKSGYLWYCISGLWNTVCVNEKGYLFNSSCEKKLQ